jgi:hypothetical protein
VAFLSRAAVASTKSGSINEVVSDEVLKSFTKG